MVPLVGMVVMETIQFADGDFCIPTVPLLFTMEDEEELAVVNLDVKMVTHKMLIQLKEAVEINRMEAAMELDYEATELEEVCWKCTHLSLTQQNELLEVLSKFPMLFNGELKKYSHFQVHLELQANAIPYSGKAYDVPYHHCEVFKNELEHLIQIGVLEKASHSEWLTGTFIRPKKDGHICWISDFQGSNKYLKWKTYPLPRIGNILAKHTGYQYLSKIDISMQYYMFELDEESHN